MLRFFSRRKGGSNSVKAIVLNSMAIKKQLRLYWKNRYLLILLLPGILFYILFRYKPMYGILIAFKDYQLTKGVWGSPWHDIDFYKTTFLSKGFWSVFKNTLIISSLKLIFGFPAPIILALLLNEVKNMMFKRVVQTVSYLPYFMSWIVLSGIFLDILSPSEGPVNYLLNMITGHTVYFLGDPAYFRGTMVALTVWKGIGYGAVIYLAALAGISPELYEAAHMDGANRWKQMLHITLPSLLPVIVILFVLNIGAIVEDDFDQIFNLYNIGVYNVGDVLSTYVYRKGIGQMLYSYATIVGLFQNILAFILVFITNKAAKKIGEFGVW
jgi:putative aldouronate transport system permease protein